MKYPAARGDLVRVPAVHFAVDTKMNIALAPKTRRAKDVPYTELLLSLSCSNDCLPRFSSMFAAISTHHLNGG
jgi:hypothetical protein